MKGVRLDAPAGAVSGARAGPKLSIDTIGTALIASGADEVMRRRLLGASG
jgi:hypothetical protein